MGEPRTVLGVDLPWGQRNLKRFAWALIGLDGRVLDLQWGRTRGQFLEYLSRETTTGLAAVLLDIPMYGCLWAAEQGVHFRPVDRCLQAVRIPLYPLHRAGHEGARLAAEVRQAVGRKDLPVHEVYPFSTLRYLVEVPSSLAVCKLSSTPFPAHGEQKPALSPRREPCTGDQATQSAAALRSSFDKLRACPEAAEGMSGTGQEGHGPHQSLAPEAFTLTSISPLKREEVGRLRGLATSGV